MTETGSIVLRGGTVLTMDDAHTVHETADVLVVGKWHCRKNIPLRSKEYPTWLPLFCCKL